LTRRAYEIKRGRKWLLAKALPKIYGDKIAAEVTGKDGAPLMPDDTPIRDIARAVLGLLQQAKLESGEGDEDDHVNGVDLNGAYAYALAEPDEPVRTFDHIAGRVD
jgi:hypothetical protein